MDLIGSAFSFSGKWILHECFIPTLLSGLQVTYPILLSSLLLRACVLWLPLNRLILDLLSTVLGVAVLWWYYETTIIYFLILVVLVYVFLLLIPSGRRGVPVGGVCVLFIVTWYVYVQCTIIASCCTCYSVMYTMNIARNIVHA